MRKQSYPIPQLTGGLVAELDGLFIEDNQSPNTHWSRWDQGRLAKEFGLRGMGAVPERAMHFDTFYMVDGTTHTLCITTDAVYRYVEASKEWTLITGSDIFTGDEDNAFTSCNYFDSAGTDIFITANGVDAVQKWDGTTWDILGGLAAAGVSSARVMITFYNHLILGFTLEGGFQCPQRIRWSATGDPEEWDFTTDPTAGFIDLVDTVDWITAFCLLGDRLFVFKERSIWEVLYTGGSTIFEFRLVIDGVGTYCPASVVSLGDELIFFGTDDVYLFDGTTLKSVGHQIFPLLYETGYKRVNSSALGRAPAIYMEETTDYLLVLPTLSDEPTWVLKYNLNLENWSQRILNNPVTALGYYTASDRTPWSTAEGTWDALTWQIAWKEKSLPPGAPTTLYGFDQGGIMEDTRSNYGIGVFWNDESRTFNGVTETWSELWEEHYFIYETKDFVFGHTARYVEFRILCMGEAFLVAYSTDGGLTWNEERTLTPSQTEYREMVYYLNQNARKMRFRIRSLNDELFIKWIEPWYVPRQRSKELHQ
jgi:hypothetical protein